MKKWYALEVSNLSLEAVYFLQTTFTSFVKSKDDHALFLDAGCDEIWWGFLPGSCPIRWDFSEDVHDGQAAKPVPAFRAKAYG